MGRSARSFPLVLEFWCPGSGDLLAASILACFSAFFLAKNDFMSAIFGELAFSGLGFCFRMVGFFCFGPLGVGFWSCFGWYFSCCRWVVSSGLVSMILVGGGGFTGGRVVGCDILASMGGGVVAVWLVFLACWVVGL